MATPMTAHFLNGDSIQGELVEYKQDSITWSSEALMSPAEFSTNQLKEIKFNSYHQLEAPESDHYATVILHNNVNDPNMRDRVRGALKAVTDDSIKLQTNFAGLLEFRRDMVAELIISDRQEMIYAGPRDLSEWTQSSQGGWSYQDGVLECTESSSISREIGTHKRIRIAFDATWQNGSQFRMLLYANGSAEDNDQRNKAGSYYEFVCQSQYAYLRKRTNLNRGRQSETVGTTGALRELDSEQKIRFEFLQDLTTGWIRLKLNGERVADWRDNNFNHENLGEHLHFYGDHSSSLKLSRIRIASWDGVVEGGWAETNRFRGMQFNETPESNEEEKIESGIQLKNGDIIQGEAVNIKDGNVTLKTKFSEFDLPISRLRTFALRTAEEEKNPELFWMPIRRSNDIRAHFANEGHITFELIDFKDGYLIGRSQTFGEAQFDLKAFSRLEFNIYQNSMPQL